MAPQLKQWLEGAAVKYANTDPVIDIEIAFEKGGVAMLSHLQAAGVGEFDEHGADQRLRGRAYSLNASPRLASRIRSMRLSRT